MWRIPFPGVVRCRLSACHAYILSAAGCRKLLALGNNGNNLLMISPDPKAYTDLGRALVRAQWVPSPSIADGKLVLRMKDRVKAWSLTP